MWPTPANQEPGWKHIEVVDKDGNPPEHPNQRFYNKNTGRLVQKGLGQVARMWPTPTTQEVEHPDMDVTDTGRRMTKNGKDSHSIGLADQVHTWPTPAACSREGVVSGGHSGLAGGSGNRQKLYKMLGKEEDKKMGSQALNPDWVEWLMGFPIGWTTVPGGIIEWATDGEIASRFLPENWKLWIDSDSWWDTDPADEGYVPRIASGVYNRVNRLKGLGNAQVPAVVAVAWMMLTEEESE